MQDRRSFLKTLLAAGAISPFAAEAQFLPITFWKKQAAAAAVSSKLYLTTSTHIAVSSDDGATWTSRALPSTLNYLSMFQVVNGKMYVSPLSGQTHYTADDGVTWSSSGYSSGLSGVAKKNGVYAAIGEDYRNSKISTDGQSWTNQTTIPNSSSDICYDLATNGTVFVGSGQYGIYVSNDGISWGYYPITGNSGSPAAVKYNGSIFLYAHPGGFLTSTDGTTWTNRASPFTNTIRDVAVKGSTFCITGYSNSSNQSAISTDGINWTQAAQSKSLGGGYGYGWQGLISNGSVFCAMADGNSIVTSPDGLVWTAKTIPTGMGPQVWGLAMNIE